ncbi:MAG: adenosylcobinamide-phosphate synthase CbiB [Candidatus Omnitrophota bacterium]|nr:adenosylcobinamide-phosphate synthase CbiB [Candidatus Omnitrophota bacterium]
MPGINIILAYFLDIIFGDPRWFPHPVRIIGFLVRHLEDFLRRYIFNLKIAGVILVVLVIGLTYFLVWGIIKAGYQLNPFFGAALEVFFIYTAIAIKDLKAHTMRVYSRLKDNDLAQARSLLSQVVGRDTGNLDEKEVARAAVETVGENFVDGILSPLFYTFIGGAPLALAYKAVSTLDSMVGYKNERYIDFGWASARLDDFANYIPARLSVLFLSLGSWVCGQDGSSAFRLALRDGRKNASPNSGLPEAAMAGALGVRLGGVNFYNSSAKVEPYIGDGACPLEARHILESIRIVYASSFLALLSGIGLTWMLKY